jgi:hypothetical protein
MARAALKSGRQRSRGGLSEDGVRLGDPQVAGAGRVLSGAVEAGGGSSAGSLEGPAAGPLAAEARGALRSGAKGGGVSLEEPPQALIRHMEAIT